MKTLYALLVGIDVYRAVPHLAGCVRDVREVAAHLGATLADGARLEVRKLCDGEATRAAVIDAFRSHLGQAGPDDAALFWFSGHGSDAEAPAWALDFEPTARVQTLVCVDSRSDGVPDLWDKELAVLLDEVAGRAGHVAVVLDSCHSEGASRELREREPAARSRAVRSVETRDPGSFLPGTIERAAAAPPMRHVELAACHSFETAEEMILDGKPRGVFSWALLRSRRRLGTTATYRDLLRAVRAELAGQVRQAPQARPRDSELLDQPFLGGTVTTPESGIWMRWTAGGWAIDAGAVHGLTSGGDVRVGVRGALTGTHGGEATIIEVRPEHSLVEPVSPWQPPRDEQFPVVVTSVPLPPTTVAVTGADPAGTDPAGAGALAAVLGVSPHLRLLGPDSPEVPGLRVTITRDARLLIHDHAGELLEDREHRGPYAVPDALAVCEHIARWRLIWDLENPASALASPVRVEILDRWGGPLERDDHDGLVARYVHGRYGCEPPEVRIRLHNTGRVPLYCVLLDLTSRFQVHANLFPGDFVAPGAYGECLEGKLIKALLPAGTPVRAGAHARDRLKLFVAERQFSAEPFRLPRLGEQFGSRKGLSSSGLLERLGGAAVFRDLGADVPDGYDWTTGKLILTTRVP